MTNQILKTFVIFVLCFLVCPPITAQPEINIKELVLKSEVFNNTRSIRILLPPGYNKPANRNKKYPVFYFTDGLPAFDSPAWNVPGTVNDLWEKGLIREFIFVGIDNGGSTKEATNPVVDRASEYIPYPDPTWTSDPAPKPMGKMFPEFLFNEVMPLVKQSYRVKSGGAKYRPCRSILWWSCCFIYCHKLSRKNRICSYRKPLTPNWRRTAPC